MTTRIPLLALLAAAAANLFAAHRGEVTCADLPIPGATVTVRRGDATRTTTTDAGGQYSFPELPDGAWDVEIEMPGFARLGGKVAASPTAPASKWTLALVPDAAPVETPAPLRRRAPAAAQSVDTRFPSLSLGALGGAGESAAPFEVSPELAASANDAVLAGNPGAGAVRNGARRLGDYHGGVGVSLDNSAWDARAYSLSGQKQDKPSFAKARPSLSIGGPLRIPKLIAGDRTTFGFNYSAGRARNWSSFNSTMPSALERAGDFSGSWARGPVLVSDPLTGQPFPGNRIPVSRMDPAAQALLRYFPLPNQPGQVRNYQYVTAVPADSDSYSGSVNRRLRQRDRISASVSHYANSSIAPQLMGFADSMAGSGWNANLSWTHPLTRHAISTTRYTFSHSGYETVPYFAYRDDVAKNLGIAGTGRDPRNWGPPNLSFTNFGGLSDGSAAQNANQSSALSENVVWNRGQHNLTFGADYSRRQVNRIADLNARGSLGFTGLATSARDAAGAPVASTGFDLADFLLGLPQTSSVRFGGGDTYFRSSAYSVLAQDDWRLAPRFTINCGLRYDYASPIAEKHDRMANLDVAQGYSAAAVVLPGERSYPRALVDSDRNNFSPRVAIAWKPSARRSTLIRSGYGWYFNTGVYDGIANNLAQQPPFATASVQASSADRPLTIRDAFGGDIVAQIANTYAVDRNYRVGYAQSWNLAVQQNIGRVLVVEVSYLGTKGTRLDMLSVPNQALPGAAPRAIGNASAFIYESSNGNSIYHGGNLRLTRRFSGGLSAQMQYTFAKSIDNASSVSGSGMGTIVQDPFDFAAERGPSSFVTRHTVSGNWQFSSGRQRPRLLKEWTIANSISWRSGWPLTATVLGNRADIGGTGLTGVNRADATGLPIDAGNGPFNLAAFAVPPATRFGNAGRGTIPGPGFLMTNASVGRSIGLGERRALDIRVEATDVFNSVNILRWGTVVNASNYGLATGAAGMRTLNANVRFRF